ncbi:MAG TPA: hypothetical protein VF553_10785 [Pyrinomonadaceae bacterium]|jgi:ElaB/YqjD/DUF883 family membrane-anchored ribosome-binding protein
MSQNNPTGGSTSGTTGTGGAGTGATNAGSTGAGGSGSGTGLGGSSSGGGTGSSSTGTGLTPSTGSGGSGGQGTGTATGIAATAQEYSKKVADAASTAKDYVSDKMTPVVDKIKDLQNTDVREVANQAKDYARQNPGQAILISAAAGLVLGLLIRGSRR